MTNTPNGTTTRRATVSLALASAIAIALSSGAMAQNGPGNGNGNAFGHGDGRPFDRTFVAASSSVEVLEATATEESTSSEPVELLRTTFDVRPQFSKDLKIRFDGECAALLDEDPEEEEPPAEEEPEQEEPAATTVSGSSVRVWVEVDGVPVPVSSDPDAESTDDGSVVLCNSNGTLDFAANEPDAIAAELGGSSSPHGFSWAAEDIGRGTHEVVVMASLDLQVEETGDDNEENGEEPGAEAEADAMALIGKRILNVDLVRADFEAQASDMQ